MPNEVVNNNLLEAFNLHLKNEFQPALNIYSSILKIEPENIYANHFLGILLIQNGYFDQGLGHVNKSINAEHSFASESEYNLKLFSSSIEAKYTQDFDFFIANEPYSKRSPGTVDDWRHLRMLEFTAVYWILPDARWCKLPKGLALSSSKPLRRKAKSFAEALGAMPMPSSSSVLGAPSNAKRRSLEFCSERYKESCL